jgi:hypothetical protein
MGIYLTYLGIGVATTFVGLAAFYLADYLGNTSDDPETVDTMSTFARAIGLFVAIVGFGGVLFGGVGVLFGLVG